MTSRFCVRAVMVLAAVGACARDAGCGEPERASRDLRSERVSIGEGDYRLVARGTRKLWLEYFDTDGSKKIEWKVRPTEYKSEDKSRWDSWIRDGQVADITEIALSRWCTTSLVAVVEVSRGMESTYWCLTFEHVERYEDDGECRPGAAVCFKGSEGRILALSGTRNCPAITVVIGRRSLTNPGAVEAGVILDHWCPSPGFIDARVGRFEPQYAPLLEKSTEQ